MRKVKTKIRKALASKFAISSIEEHLANYLPNDLNVLIDVGANNGNFTKLLRSIKPIDKVFFCEANANNLITLEKFKHKNDSIISSIISNKEGEERFFIYEKESTSSLFSFDENMKELSELNLKAVEERVLNAITIDKLVEENKIKEIDLLKIDVQGAELKVLEGANNSLPRIKNIWVEVSMKRVYKNTPIFSEIYEYLDHRGFIFKSFCPVFKSKDGEILQADVLFVNKSFNE